jgi:hypothetical protein
MTAQVATHDDTTITTLIDRPSAEDYDRIQVLQLIEDALRDTTWCPCGAVMTVEVEDGTLWLECPRFLEPTSGRLAWLRDGIRLTLHHKLVLSRDMQLAA